MDKCYRCGQSASLEANVDGCIFHLCKDCDNLMLLTRRVAGNKAVIDFLIGCQTYSPLPRENDPRKNVLQCADYGIVDAMIQRYFEEMRKPQ